MTELLPQEIAAAMDAAEAKAEAAMRHWLDKRTPETMRPLRDLLERPNLCAPPELSPNDPLLLDQDQREILLDLLAERATDLQGELDQIAEDEEEYEDEEEGYGTPEGIQYVEDHKSDVRAWLDGTVALHQRLNRMFGRG